MAIKGVSRSCCGGEGMRGGDLEWLNYFRDLLQLKIKIPNGWRTIKLLVHKIRLHGRRGKGMAEFFSREKLRQAPQKEGGWKILCCLLPV